MTGLLLSGGMDSISIAWWKRPRYAITIDYGQKPAEAEIAASRAICMRLNIQHEIIRVDCSSLGSGDMAGTAPETIAPIPEWWPFRNQLLVTLAAMLAVRVGIHELVIGCLATDREHGDGRPEFVASLSKALEFQEGEVRLSAPAIAMTAVDLVKHSAIPRELLAWAHSCHTGNFACGQCRGCVKHFKTWEALGWDAH